MFSLDRFYNILHNNLISRCSVTGKSIYFHPFGTYQNTLILDNNFNNPITVLTRNWNPNTKFIQSYFFDQEPLYHHTKSILTKTITQLYFDEGPTRIQLFANSEKSNLKQDIVTSFGLHDWYYFFHGFAALDWYRDFQYIEPQSFNRFDKVFICYNHLISKYRSYRLHLVSNLIEQDLIQHGYVSLFLKDEMGTWQDAIQDAESLLDSRAKVKIYQALNTQTEPLIIDTNDPDGTMSANLNIDQSTDALWHIVTETVYFLPKLHLTEKIFKPIVSKRPFILVAAPGNLAYLKSYGFRTFDRWIDESYDQEADHYIRIEKITAEIARLCAMEPADLIIMHDEMKEVLEYNFNHFYNDFKGIIVDELVDNFEHIMISNDISTPDLAEVKKRLKQ